MIGAAVGFYRFPDKVIVKGPWLRLHEAGLYVKAGDSGVGQWYRGWIHVRARARPLHQEQSYPRV